VLGTLGYCSPEQLRGEPAAARSDIFSFGCVLYEMLSQTPPFRRRTAAETGSAILTEDPAPLSGADRPMAPAMQGIVKRCLEKQPHERFSSAHDLALALRAVSGGTGTPATIRSLVRRALRRRWVAAGAVLSALAVATVVGVRFRRRLAAPGTTGIAPSIAVLPFTNLSGEKEQEYFSDGLSEELMGLLGKVKGLHIAGRTSSFAFKGKNADLADIGRQLHVATVLEGSVRRSGNRLRVSAELVDVADGYQLWAETYDRTMSDVFAVQDDIAGAVVAALKGHAVATGTPGELAARDVKPGGPHPVPPGPAFLQRPEPRELAPGRRGLWKRDSAGSGVRAGLRRPRRHRGLSGGPGRKVRRHGGVGRESAFGGREGDLARPEPGGRLFGARPLACQGL
jgi:serine/threonine-protein kinase